MPASVEYNIQGYVAIRGASFSRREILPESHSSVEFPAVGFEPPGIDKPDRAFIPVERGDPRILEWVPDSFVKTSDVTRRGEYVVHLNGVAQRVK